MGYFWANVNRKDILKTKDMKQIIYTPNAPEPIGPYSQAVVANGTLYMSGQIAINPQSGELMTHEIQEETAMVMENMKAILDAAGYSFADIACLYMRMISPC